MAGAVLGVVIVCIVCIQLRQARIHTRPIKTSLTEPSDTRGPNGQRTIRRAPTATCTTLSARALSAPPAGHVRRGRGGGMPAHGSATLPAHLPAVPCPPITHARWAELARIRAEQPTQPTRTDMPHSPPCCPLLPCHLWWRGASMPCPVPQTHITLERPNLLPGSHCGLSRAGSAGGASLSASAPRPIPRQPPSTALMRPKSLCFDFQHCLARR